MTSAAPAYRSRPTDPTCPGDGAMGGVADVRDQGSMAPPDTAATPVCKALHSAPVHALEAG